MSTPIVIEDTLPLGRRRRASRPAANGAGSAPNSLPSSCIPRVARLLALAWHVDELVRSGTVSSYAAAARLGHVSRARLSQILSLLNLAPDLQEQLLFLQRSHGRQSLVLRHVLTVAAALDWQEQRRRWRRLRRGRTAAS
jgi:hypothetical protein